MSMADRSYPVWGRPGWAGVLREGLVAGLLGYLAVVVVVALLDLVRGRAAFDTARVLGTALFGDPEGTGWGPVFAWNGVHLLASLAVATLGAGLVLASEHYRGFWYFALMALITVAVGAIGALGAFGVEITRLVDWTTVVVGTAAWLGAMTLTFALAHRRIFSRISADLDADG